MNAELTDIATRFVDGKSSAQIFVDDYIDCWKKEGDDGRILEDPPALSEALSSLFCLADLYNPNPGGEDYELDEASLRTNEW